MSKKIIISIAIALGIAASITTVSAAYSQHLSTTSKSSTAKINSKINTSSEIYPEIETLNSKKELIFNNILNSIDHFDSVSGKFETTLITGSPLSVCYEVDIPSQLSSQKILGSQINTEILCKDERILEVDNNKQIYSEIPFISQYDSSKRTPLNSTANIATNSSPVKNDEKRVKENQNGEMEFYYRTNLTNAGYAATSIFPQELCFGFLTELESWDITGIERILNRTAIVISGKTSDKGYANKLQTFSYTMKFDYETGILLDFKGYSESGEISQELNTTEIKINQKDINLSDQIERKINSAKSQSKTKMR